MCKSLRSPNLHRKEHGCKKVFFQGEIVDFSRWWPNAFFQGWANSGEIYFTNWKLRNKYFSTKTLIGKYKEKCLPRFFIC